MLLSDKIVIISGAGAGLGKKLALQAAEHGATVVLTARSTGVTSGIVDEVTASGGRAIALQADVAHADQCMSVAEQVLARFGSIDGLVNAAFSFGPIGSVEDAAPDQWLASMNVTLFGALRMAQAVIPAMKEQGGGAIVNVGAMSARRPVPHDGAYSIAKAALGALTRQMALDLGGYNIRTNNAIIGWMWGKPVEDYFTWNETENGIAVDHQLKEAAARIPLGRMPTDDQCASSIIFLLSDFAAVITGASLDVNGGEYMAQ